jgi:hypothetical protein
MSESQSRVMREKSTSGTMQRGNGAIFHGLLYIDRAQQKNVNLRGSADPLDVYLRCAALCAKSVAYHGHDFRLVTNDKSLIEERLADLGIGSINILEQKFSLDVPNNARFRSAHFKLELYNQLGSGRFGDQVGVIDIDSVMINPIDLPQLTEGTLLAYDITDQVVQQFGHDLVRSDIERINGNNLTRVRWFGGEFLFGHSESFRELAAAVFELWPTYVRHIHDLHHASDEMPVAAAIPKTGLQLIDAGHLVVRWWTARTYFEQMPFESAITRSVLHLPSDKTFLSECAEIEFCPERFIFQFRQAARGKLFRRRVFNTAETLLGRKRKYVARLS